ncbi:MAG: glycosyltransferase family 2 protein [Verrucomicrobia bacterium]|nr:glycosyltransferase family 2 protein [Verrucomicrobiota bacterium]
MSATIILPAYNEESALPQVLKELARVLDDSYEIMVIDDGSSDRTGAVAEGFNCRLVRHQKNRGKGAAMRTGIAEARSDFIVFMDADATYPVSAVPQIVRLLRTHDLVRCQRERSVENMNTVNRLGNAVFDRLLRMLHGLEGHDHLSGLYGVRRTALLAMNLESRGFEIEVEIGIKAQALKLSRCTLPITYQARLGEKKLRAWRDGCIILGRIFVLLLIYNPLATFIIPGFVIMLLSIAGAALLGRGPVITPYFGLSIHSFIVATLGVLAAFQLIIFGMAAALYGLEAGSKAPMWLVWVSSRAVRLTAGIAGFLLALTAGIGTVGIVVRWIAEGAGIFLETQRLVLSAALLVWGMQVLSAAFFVSIFAGRLRRLDAGDGRQPPAQAAEPK